jgi:hypothetical protein
MRKCEEITNAESCLNKTHDDELVFVLRAKDHVAPATILFWADRAQAAGCHEIGKINGARETAYAMAGQRQAIFAGEFKDEPATLADPREAVARFAAWLADAWATTALPAISPSLLGELAREFSDKQHFPRG